MKKFGWNFITKKKDFNCNVYGNTFMEAQLSIERLQIPEKYTRNLILENVWEVYDDSDKKTDCGKECSC